MMGTLIHSFFVSDTIELAFQVTELEGNYFGDIRQFCHSTRYTGPTKSGLFLRIEFLDALLEAAKQNKHLLLDGKVEERIEEIRVRNSTTIVISLVESTLDDNPVCIDIREHVVSLSYTGFTKKGFRISTEHIDEFLHGLELLVKEIHKRLDA